MGGSNVEGGVDAPGGPGIPPTWTSSAKHGLGTSLSTASRVWFTLSHGIFNEIYYPDVDQACVRDLGLIVTDGRTFFSEEKRHTNFEVAYPEPGVPAYQLTNTCREGRYLLEKEILTDPRRDVVLQRTRFAATQGLLKDYRLYALLAPHLGNRGSGNSAWVSEYKGVPMLLAEGHGSSVALACSTPWLNRSVGYVGFSDGWQDLNRHFQMTWHYPRASDGNVALTGEIDLQKCHGEFVFSLGFGRNPAEACQRALASIQDGFESALELYQSEWQDWQNTLHTFAGTKKSSTQLYRTSTAVLRAHEAKRMPGGIIASLSIPWGFARGDNDLGGYHLVWPRDLVEAAGGLLAAGASEDVRRVLFYLQATQEADGHWAQNMWLDGTPYWSGIQMDETALPILLVDLAWREGVLREADLERLWPMVRGAAEFLLRNGPVTQQDRWEEDPGYSPFTLAVEIAALLAAAELAGRAGEEREAHFLREIADAWNSSIDRWTYVTGTDLARELGVEGYYVRIAPPETAEAASPAGGFVAIKNRPPGESVAPAEHLVSPDFLALVRFGLRSAADRRIVDTLKVVDALLKTDTSHGPAWHRYNGDGYGEQDDGSPFEGTGIGRAWPLLTGERAHYELAAGRREKALRLRKTIESFANRGGFLPEQIWDSADIPERELYFGRASGSAMPLVWAHAEYVKLLRSIRDGKVFDMPPQPVQRYQVEEHPPRYMLWAMNQKCRSIPVGMDLRLNLLGPALVRWRYGRKGRIAEVQTLDSRLGLYYVDLPTSMARRGTQLRFRIQDLETGEETGEFVLGVGP